MGKQGWIKGIHKLNYPQEKDESKKYTKKRLKRKYWKYLCEKESIGMVSLFRKTKSKLEELSTINPCKEGTSRSSLILNESSLEDFWESITQKNKSIRTNYVYFSN